MKLLVVDDEPGLRRSLRLLLSEEGFEVAEAADGETGLARVLAEQFDVVLCDVRMPSVDGLEFLRRHRAAGGTALVIMMSAYGSEEAAIAAMKEGAYDYIPKPFRADEVVLVLRKAAEREGLRREVESLRSALGSGAASPDIVAESAAMRSALDVIAKVAPHATTVLITGESGTGKELVARAVHDQSPRRRRPVRGRQLRGDPGRLLESELFGHVRGAFTGAVATAWACSNWPSDGTLFLDEIGELPLPLQVKLLRVLQDGEVRRVGDRAARRVDVRVVAATARELEAGVAAGTFREDLFYRLNVITVRLPPLVERPEDVPALVRVLLARHCARLGIAAPGSSPMRCVRSSTTPGLETCGSCPIALERALVLAQGRTVRRDDLPVAVLEPEVRRPGPRVQRRSHAPAPRRRSEAQIIREALLRTGGNRRKAAQLLGISVRALFYKLKGLGITDDRRP